MMAAAGPDDGGGGLPRTASVLHQRIAMAVSFLSNISMDGSDLVPALPAPERKEYSLASPTVSVDPPLSATAAGAGGAAASTGMARVASGANFSEVSSTSFTSHDARVHAAIQFLSNIPLGAHAHARSSASTGAGAGASPTAATIGGMSAVEEQPPTVPVTPRDSLAAVPSVDEKKGEEKYGDDAAGAKPKPRTYAPQPVQPARMASQSSSERAPARMLSRRESQDKENELLRKDAVVGRRVVLATRGGAFLVTSVLKPSEARVRRPSSPTAAFLEPHPLAEVKQPEPGKTSMANLFKRPVETSYAKMLQQGADKAEPLSLEDELLNHIGPQNKVVMKLPGRLNSVIGFAQGADVKKELNKKFAERHEWLHPSMTLSKIRRVREDMNQLGRVLNLEYSTVALAFVYFKQLVAKNVVDKVNRKLGAAVCLLLALKFNELRSDTPHGKVIYKRFFQEAHNVLLVDKADIIKCEFAVFAKLDMDLNPVSELLHPEVIRVARAIHATDRDD